MSQNYLLLNSLGHGTYLLFNYLGHGTYGVVVKTVNVDIRKIVAMKFSHDCDVTLNEGGLLKFLSPSKYVVGFSACEKIEGCDDQYIDPPFVYIAMEYMDVSLDKFIHVLHVRRGSSIFGCHYRLGVMKRLLWELCNGVAYCHSKGVAHRDLKPSNCLINMGATVLKIADFGMAVRVEDSEHGVIENNKYQEYVTLWSRAPELLMGRTSYNCFAVDVWTMGCIFAEMFIGEPLLLGQSVKEQLDIIFPNPGKPSPSLTRFVKNIGCLEGVDLLKQMLQVDGNKRITAKEALQHPYFQCYRTINSCHKD